MKVAVSRALVTMSVAYEDVADIACCLTCRAFQPLKQFPIKARGAEKRVVYSPQ